VATLHWCLSVFGSSLVDGSSDTLVVISFGQCWKMCRLTIVQISASFNDCANDPSNGVNEHGMQCALCSYSGWCLSLSGIVGVAAISHVAFWRSQNHREHRSAFLAAAGRGSLLVESGNQSIDLGEESNGRKLLIGMLVATGSFSVSSPHFSLNLLTVFLCSISFGLSMSLESMEVSRADVTFRTTGSLIRPLSMVTIVILSCLVGQLVGCSGGFLFVVEFMFESMFLVLGGAGTLSPGATESWFTFFCLSLTAFWGYLFGRVAVLDGIRQKKRVVSSIMLCLCIVATACLWLLAVFGWNWDFPVSLVILRPTVDKDLRNGGSQFTSRQLQ
jgi:hypothetical protein